MNPFVQVFQTLNLPKFVLIKNIKFEVMYEPDTEIIGGELLGTSEDYTTLEAMIPIPTYPTDSQKATLINEFLDVDNKEEFREIAAFDDSIDGLRNDFTPSDLELYGASYTILLLCETNPEKVASFLSEKITKLTENDILDSETLISFWDMYVDRIHLFPFGATKNLQGDKGFQNEITEKLIAHINTLPNAPAAEEWEVFEQWMAN